MYNENMSFIGQVCLHIRGFFIVTEAPQFNRMTGQDTDNAIILYKQAMYKKAKKNYIYYVCTGLVCANLKCK